MKSRSELYGQEYISLCYLLNSVRKTNKETVLKNSYAAKPQNYETSCLQYYPIVCKVFHIRAIPKQFKIN